MSWHYLQGQAEVSSEAISWDGEQFAPSKLKTTLGAYYCRDKETESCHDSRYGMMLQRSMETPGEGELMWYQGDSPVRTYRQPEMEQGLMENDPDCGLRWPASLAKYNPGTYSWRTAQCLLFGGLEEFSGTWPRWGMMQDGECWGVTMLGYPPDGRECGFWPAAMASNCKASMSQEAILNTLKSGGQLHVSHVQTLQGVPLSHVPLGYQWVMGWPTHWTRLEPLEMDKFLSWCSSHGKS